MADTTKANVLLIAPDLSVVDDTIWTIILADVATQIPTTAICSEDMQEPLQRYLVAHTMTVATGIGAGGSISGNLERERVGDIEVEYGGASTVTGLDKTKYGLEFQRMWFRYRRAVII